MSIRTIIEINHDYLNMLKEHPVALAALIEQLAGVGPPEAVPGIRILGQRHHIEAMKLTLGSAAAKRTIED